jgi:hypothetical protein
MTKQQILSSAAAACRACADYYDPEEAEDELFMKGWRSLWDGYQALVESCPPCEPEDPGNPPPQ